MNAVWVGGPKDGDVLALPDETKFVRVTIEPEPTWRGGPTLDNPGFEDSTTVIVCSVLPFRHANGLRGHAIDFYNMHDKGFLHGTE